VVSPPLASNGSGFNARKDYINRVAAVAKNVFIAGDEVDITGLVIAGCSNLKMELKKSKNLDPRLYAVLFPLVDVSYGGRAGLQEAIRLSEELISDFAIGQERQMLEKFFHAMSTEGNYACGVQNVMKVLELGAVQDLICWENLPTVRYVLRNEVADETRIVFSNPKKKRDSGDDIADLMGKNCEDYQLWHIQSSCPLIDWLCEHYTEFGISLSLVSKTSSVGSQFVNGFEGIGALLRFSVEDWHEDSESDDGWLSDDGDYNQFSDDTDWNSDEEDELEDDWLCSGARDELSTSSSDDMSDSPVVGMVEESSPAEECEIPISFNPQATPFVPSFLKN